MGSPKKSQLLSSYENVFSARKYSVDFLTENEDHYQNEINNFEDDNLEDIFHKQNFNENNQNNNINSFNFNDDTYVRTFLQTERIEQEQQNNNNNIQQEQDDQEICSSSNFNPLDEEDLKAPQKQFFEFEGPDFNKDSNESNSTKNQQQENTTDEYIQLNQQLQQKYPIFKVTQAIHKKKKQRDYDKNICRYIARCIIRCGTDQTYQSKMQEICKEFGCHNNFENLYDQTRKFLLGKIEFITGHRAFRDLLCIEEDDENMLEKQVFRKFTYWFLKERAFRYIMTGAMTDKKSYLKFKNQIMLVYVNKPEKWESNAKIASKRR